MSNLENKEEAIKQAINLIQDMNENQSAIVIIADDENMTGVNINLSLTKQLAMVESYREDMRADLMNGMDSDELRQKLTELMRGE